nr:hypothetical protein [Paraflavitalea speifideiaquila]
MSIIWDLFTNIIEASTVLNTDSAYRAMLTAKRQQLFPLHIGKRATCRNGIRIGKIPSHTTAMYPICLACIRDGRYRR